MPIHLDDLEEPTILNIDSDDADHNNSTIEMPLYDKYDTLDVTVETRGTKRGSVNQSEMNKYNTSII